jgi:hypothetical protein
VLHFEVAERSASKRAHALAMCSPFRTPPERGWSDAEGKQFLLEAFHGARLPASPPTELVNVQSARADLTSAQSGRHSPFRLLEARGISIQLGIALEGESTSWASLRVVQLTDPTELVNLQSDLGDPISTPSGRHSPPG